jgi:hypothetical protein
MLRNSECWILDDFFWFPVSALRFQVSSLATSHYFFNCPHPVPQKRRDHILPQPSTTAQHRKENLHEVVESAFRATMGNGNFIPEGSKLFEIPLL